MEQNRSRKADSPLFGQEIPRPLGRVHIKLPTDAYREPAECSPHPRTPFI
jgi:hypothetical protein